MENEEDEIVISGKTGKSYKVVKKANDTYEITKDNAAPITKNKDDEDTFDGVQITLGSVEGTTNIVNGIADYANYNTGPDEPIIIRGTLNGHQSTISVEDVNNSFLFEGKTVIGSDAANDHSVEFLQHEYCILYNGECRYVTNDLMQSNFDSTEWKNQTNCSPWTNHDDY